MHILIKQVVLAADFCQFYIWLGNRELAIRNDVWKRLFYPFCKHDYSACQS